MGEERHQKITLSVLMEFLVSLQSVLSMERESEQEQDCCRMDNEGKIKIIIVIEEKNKSRSSLRRRLNSGKCLVCFVLAFILV